MRGQASDSSGVGRTNRRRGDRRDWRPSDSNVHNIIDDPIVDGAHDGDMAVRIDCDTIRGSGIGGADLCHRLPGVHQPLGWFPPQKSQRFRCDCCEVKRQQRCDDGPCAAVHFCPHVVGSRVVGARHHRFQSFDNATNQLSGPGQRNEHRLRGCCQRATTSGRECQSRDKQHRDGRVDGSHGPVLQDGFVPWAVIQIWCTGVSHLLREGWARDRGQHGTGELRQVTHRTVHWLRLGWFCYVVSRSRASSSCLAESVTDPPVSCRSGLVDGATSGWHMIDWWEIFRLTLEEDIVGFLFGVPRTS